MPGTTVRTCSKCGVEKPLPDGFYYEKGKPRACCKVCHKAKGQALRDRDRDAHNAKVREYRRQNPDKVVAAHAKHWAKYKDEINAARREDRTIDPEKYRKQARKKNGDPRHLAVRRARYARQREHINALVRAKRAANPERWRERDRRARARPENREKVRRSNRRYYAANRERWEILRQNYIARKNAVPNEPYTRREIWERDEGVCKGCGVSLPYKKGFHIDHVVPLSKGGPNTPANVQLLCPKCNREKWARTDWIPPRPSLF